MDISYVKKLIKLLSEANIDEIEIEEEGKKIRLAKHGTNSVPAYSGQPIMQPSPLFSVPPAAQAMLAPLPVQAPPPVSAPQVGAEKKFHEIKSPIVGTFYRAPAPDAAPFVEVGSVVQPGTVLCIVEAMKLMNEIESDVAGTVARVQVENGQPVEYGQPLFLVEPT